LSDAPSSYQPPPVAIHPPGHGHVPHHPYLQHHFDDMEQQAEASTLGMWVFLVTEIMFFGGMFMAYILYRVQYPEAFLLGSNHLDVAPDTKIIVVTHAAGIDFLLEGAKDRKNPNIDYASLVSALKARGVKLDPPQPVKRGRPKKER